MFETPQNSNVHCLILLYGKEHWNPKLWITDRLHVRNVLFHTMKDTINDMRRNSLCDISSRRNLNRAETWSENISNFDL